LRRKALGCLPSSSPFSIAGQVGTDGGFFVEHLWIWLMVYAYRRSYCIWRSHLELHQQRLGVEPGLHESMDALTDIIFWFETHDYCKLCFIQELMIFTWLFYESKASAEGVCRLLYPLLLIVLVSETRVWWFILHAYYTPFMGGTFYLGIKSRYTSQVSSYHSCTQLISFSQDMKRESIPKCARALKILTCALRMPEAALTLISRGRRASLCLSSLEHLHSWGRKVSS